MKPMKISVALCTYNGEKFLREQIDSILNQSVSVGEIVVCDDCSTDTTTIILKEYHQKYPELFRIFINEKNLKSNVNFEKAIGLTTGDYIFLADQDDKWRYDKVEKTIKVFSENPSAEGVFSNADLMDEKSNKIDTKLDLWSNINFFISLNGEKIDLYKSLTYIGNFVTGATLCLKKEVKDFGLPFQTSSSFLHDEWLALILCSRNTLYYSEERLMSYRLHTNQQVGMGKIKNKSNALQDKENYTKLMLGLVEPNNYSESKKILKRTVSQYHKYSDLNVIFSNSLFNTNIDLLFSKYKKIELLMQRLNPMLFYFRKKKLKI